MVLLLYYYSTIIIVIVIIIIIITHLPAWPQPRASKAELDFIFEINIVSQSWWEESLPLLFPHEGLIDGYTGERAALEEQLRQKEELHLILEQELQVSRRQDLIYNNTVDCC